LVQLETNPQDYMPSTNSLKVSASIWQKLMQPGCYHLAALRLRGVSCFVLTLQSWSGQQRLRTLMLRPSAWHQLIPKLSRVSSATMTGARPPTHALIMRYAQGRAASQEVLQLSMLHILVPTLVLRLGCPQSKCLRPTCAFILVKKGGKSHEQ